MLAHFLGAGDALLQRYPEGHAQLPGDGLSLGHHVGGQLPGRSELTDIRERRVAERADGIEAQVSPCLEPDF